MEIERKYLIIHIPFDIAGYPFHQIEAGISKHCSGRACPSGG